MTEGPISLDGRRSDIDLHAAEGRRRLAIGQLPLPPPQPHIGSLEDQMLAEPARTWRALAEKWRFLLESYAATPEAADERMQRLIQQALADMERLSRRGKRK